ncbi:MAG TPA: hypothetical protein VE464_24090 [Streptosporangiaceae bacterium]|nr:hypothetical protein [Streptosporangiaceae bacterium]
MVELRHVLAGGSHTQGPPVRHAAGIGFHQGAQPGNIVNSPQTEAKVRQCESVVHLDVSGWYQ